MLAGAIVAGVIGTHVDVASRTTVNPFNLYGYFTIQSNLIAAVVLVAAGVVALRGRTAGPALSTLRAVAVTCVVVVGLVFALLLAPLGAAGGVQLAWANTILHEVSPVLVALDWLLVGDRERVPLRRIWAVLVYPAIWTAVVLVRGATDGWVPYPFLDPAQGYGVIAAYCGAILVVFVVVGLLVLVASRWRGLLPRQ